jgi:hypothetical protein
MFPDFPDLADHFRRLFEALKEAWGAEGRRGVLAGPVALLIWIRTRRLRKEAEAWLEQFRVLMEQLVVLLEQFRAGTLNAANAPPVREAAEATPRALPRRRRHSILKRRPIADIAARQTLNVEIMPESRRRMRSRRVLPAHPQSLPCRSRREGRTLLAPRARPPPRGLILGALRLKRA